MKACKSLNQLRETMATLSFEDLTQKDLEKVIKNYKNLTGDSEPEDTATKAGFNYVVSKLNAYGENVNNSIKEEEVMTTNNTNNATVNNDSVKEEEVMKKNVFEGLDEKVKATWTEQVFPKIKVVGEVLGMTQLYNGLIDSISEMDKVDSIEGIAIVARRCEQKVRNNIRILEAINSEDSLKKAAYLKTMLDDGEHHESIFAVGERVITWACKKACGYVKKAKDSISAKVAEKKFLGAICSGISKVAKVLKDTVVAVAKFAGNIVLTVASYTIAVTVKLSAMVFNGIATVAKKLIGFLADKFVCEESEDDFEDDFIDNFEDTYEPEYYEEEYYDQMFQDSIPQ